ncbi:hypothetical protein K488DRAFT_80684 [Vararia minispora EC-137]|uniref:Uncharacterized protein n=1 Tax=Vararia minispora EC-137 TaxID=1314806 RepID=A0ACB8QB06_9AGAM|nr:hypothetical protein K488DRAFT_80684 [Vararia minispora EC-137]
MSAPGKKSTTNKDKSAAAATYSVSDIVLGKVRGYPPWPGMVVDPENVTEDVASERPPGKKTPFYCVRFFPKGDHSWLQAKDISRLQPHEISAFIADPVKKGELLDGYKIAQDPRKWQEEQDQIAAQAAEAAADAEVDELEDGTADADGAKPKKRKRGGDADGKPKSARKDAPAAAKKKGGAAAGAKGRKSNGKSRALVESEDDAERADADGEADNADDAGPSKALTSPPPAKKTKRDKDDPKFANDPEAQKVKNWRHSLQKTFLTDGKPPKPEEMPASDELFRTIEQYDGMTEDYLQYSKIPKVMRHIYLLAEGKIPRDDEFAFRTRARSLFEKWHPAGAGGKKANGSGGAETNGNAEGAGAEESPAAKEATPDAPTQDKEEPTEDVVMGDAA